MASRPGPDAHDPLAMLEEADAAPLSVWASLARQAREVAGDAERLAVRPPAERIGPVGEDEVDEFAVLDERARAVTSLVAACRRETYQALVDGNWTPRRIADAGNVTVKAVYKVLGRGKPR